MATDYATKCIGCGLCAKTCRKGAIKVENKKVIFDESQCSFCGRCYKSCPTDAWEDTHGYIVSFGGLFGNNINKGETIIPFIEDKQKLLYICDAAITFFAENANPGERFKYTIDRIGRNVFAKKITEVYNG